MGAWKEDPDKIGASKGVRGPDRLFEKVFVTLWGMFRLNAISKVLELDDGWFSKLWGW